MSSSPKNFQPTWYNRVGFFVLGHNERTASLELEGQEVKGHRTRQGQGQDKK